jgi:hypothetical protein
MRISVALFLVLSLFASTQAKGQAAAQADWRFAHPDATLVGGIRPAAVLSSPLLATALSEATKQDPSVAMMVGIAQGMLGGITEVRFSLLDNGTKQPDVVALITGSFDESMAELLAQANTKYVRLDEHTFLFGNGPSLDKAAARMKQTTPVLQPRALAGTDTLAVHDVWLSGKLPDLAAAKGLKLDVRGIALGVSLHENLEMELAMEATSPAAATSLLKSAHEAEAAQLKQYKGLLKSFIDGNTAHFRLSIPSAVAVEAMRTRATPALSASNVPPPLPMPPTRHRTTIVIQGLDGGPREIPLQ